MSVEIKTEKVANKKSLPICRKCGSQGPFSQARLDRSDRICCPCSNKARALKRARDPIERIIIRLYVRLHRTGIPTRMLTKDQVRSILDQWKHCSVVSGKTENLVLMSLPKSPPHQENWDGFIRHLVPVTATEARKFAHYKDPMSRLPPKVLRYMKNKLK